MRPVGKPEQIFRMPSGPRQREYALGGLCASLGLAAVAVAGVVSPQGAGLMLVIVLGAGLVVYAVFSRRVWLSLSIAGMQGRGFLGRRRALLRWSEPVVAQDHWLPKGPHGVALFRLGAGGKPRFSRALFIPDAILDDEGFRAALRSYAPRRHPLLLRYGLPPEVCERLDRVRRDGDADGDEDHRASPESPR